MRTLPLLVVALAAPTAAMAASADNNNFWLGCVTGAVITALVLFVGWFVVGLARPAREYAWEDGRVG